MKRLPIMAVVAFATLAALPAVATAQPNDQYGRHENSQNDNDRDHHDQSDRDRNHYGRNDRDRHDYGNHRGGRYRNCYWTWRHHHKERVCQSTWRRWH